MMKKRVEFEAVYLAASLLTCTNNDVEYLIGIQILSLN